MEGSHRDLEAKIEQNQAETRCAADATQVSVNELSAQLAQLTTQLNKFRPMLSEDVVTGQNQLSQDVDKRMQVQSQRIDTITDSVQKIEKDSADNTKLLHDLMINMENLGESFKQFKSEVMNWEGTGNLMETEEDKEHRKLQNALLQEVCLSFLHVEDAGNPSFSTPIPMSVPVPTPILSESSTSVLPESEDQRMKDRFDQLRAPVSERKPVSEGVNYPFSFATPASMTLPYPGLDGHPRRIVLTPVSAATSQSPATITRSPDQISQETAEFIQRQENEKKQ